MQPQKRILSGMRPTGRLHLGNLHGALLNWVELQDSYESFFFVADWHALTSNFEDTSDISAATRDMLLDWLSAGLDPKKATLFVQSHILEHAELYLLLGMITPVPWLERNPTYKEQIVQMQNKDLSNFGFLGYPILQAADIIIYKAWGVPVGIDQVPHVELTREIARRFNYLYGETFSEPEVVLTKTSKILGLDRRKMSKSYNNAIYFTEPEDQVLKKISRMVTDPQRMRKDDPGNPDVCNVYDFHKLYSSAETTAEINEDCRNATIGCVACKKILGQNLANILAPYREKRTQLESQPNLVSDIITDGDKRARKIAQQTMAEVHERLHLS